MRVSVAHVGNLLVDVVIDITAATLMQWRCAMSVDWILCRVWDTVASSTVCTPSRISQLHALRYSQTLKPKLRSTSICYGFVVQVHFKSKTHKS